MAIVFKKPRRAVKSYGRQVPDTSQTLPEPSVPPTQPTPFQDEEKDTDTNEMDEPMPQQETIPIAEVVREMKVPFTISIASKRNTGKTVLAKHLVYEMVRQKRIEKVILLSNTSEFNKDYDFLPKKYRQKFSNELLTKIVESQMKSMTSGKAPQLLLLLDDVVGYSKDTTGSRSEIILSMYATSRHYNVSVMLLSQIANYVLSPAIKNNSDYIYFSRLNRQQLWILWEAMTNIDKKDFVKMAEERNRDFRFLLYDNTTHETDPERFIKIVKADPEIDFNVK